MVLLEILGGWVVVSCAAAPFIGRFMAFNTVPAEHEPKAARSPLQPAAGV